MALSFQMSPRSSIDRDVALDLLFSVVLTNLLGIVGRICGDDEGAILNIGNLKSSEDLFVNTGSFILVGETVQAMEKPF